MYLIDGFNLLITNTIEMINEKTKMVFQVKWITLIMKKFSKNNYKL